MSVSEKPWVQTLGDGSLSFSLCLSEKYKQCKVDPAYVCYHTNVQEQEGDIYQLATTFDSSTDLVLKYRESMGFRNTIHERNGLVLGSVDATCLDSSLRRAQSQIVPTDTQQSSPFSFDLLIFNNPHLGFESCKHHHVLQAHFFYSAKEVLNARGQVHVTLCDDQPGRWGLFEAAYRQGFACAGAFQLRECEWPAYTNKRHQNGTSFPISVMVTYVFVRVDEGRVKDTNDEDREERLPITYYTTLPPTPGFQPEPVSYKDVLFVQHTPLVDVCNPEFQAQMMRVQEQPQNRQDKLFRAQGDAQMLGDAWNVKRLPKQGEAEAILVESWKGGDKVGAAVGAAAGAVGAAALDTTADTSITADATTPANAPADAPAGEHATIAPPNVHPRQLVKLARLQARLEQTKQQKASAATLQAVFPCTQCDRRFKTEKAQQDHAMVAHSAANTEVVLEQREAAETCAVCGQETVLHTLQPLNNEFPCTECDKSFTNSRALQQHMLFKHK